MSEGGSDPVGDAQRRALFAAEVIVNRRLHDFSTRYRSQYSNDVAAERKAIEQEIRRLRRRVPGAPAVSDTLIAEVAAASALDEDTVAAVLRALGTLRPDLLSTGEEPLDVDEDDED
ncbi:hypothetical protein HL658_01755 [Azospirillum sp. RWY-5-1]|uniref:Uncharacterized protein n=1 Tax=Azospirillum oleiclasticum TaxID=2735135 RepID=A0ABX2T2S6_9PROT|nr:hypothetical protein [Azospirillum oleiclasticum]NYZ11260.1 hypothetical protein [Azospirillum oleiclasticum]NYZ18421.1 hypothetical protein [Azospirillum oleiclasticum]